MGKSWKSPKSLLFKKRKNTAIMENVELQSVLGGDIE